MPLGDYTKGGQAKPDQTKRSGVRLGEVKRSETRAISSIEETMALFEGLFMLTIKDNANAITEAHLKYLVAYCAKFCKSEVIRQEFEFGKQGRFHVHAVCQSKSGKMPNAKALDAYLKKYILWVEHTEETPNGHKIERERLHISSLTFHISPIKDENHKNQVEKYIVKENSTKYDDINFID